MSLKDEITPLNIIVQEITDAKPEALTDEWAMIRYAFVAGMGVALKDPEEATIAMEDEFTRDGGQLVEIVEAIPNIMKMMRERTPEELAEILLLKRMIQP